MVHRMGVGGALLFKARRSFFLTTRILVVLFEFKIGEVEFECIYFNRYMKHHDVRLWRSWGCLISIYILRYYLGWHGLDFQYIKSTQWTHDILQYYKIQVLNFTKLFIDSIYPSIGFKIWKSMNKIVIKRFFSIDSYHYK